MSKHFLSLLTAVVVVVTALFYSESQSGSEENMTNKSAKIIFLHHSTGKNIARGKVSRLWYKLFGQGDLDRWMTAYNRANDTRYDLTKRIFPSSEGYGWENYPYDYYNIWVQHAGEKPFKSEPTLEILTPEYDVIMLKHCFPVSALEENDGKADAASAKRTLANYKLQYAALKEKMHQYPQTRFILWTGAALTKQSTSESAAQRMKQFVEWVKNDWDEKGDNIYLWDFYALETQGGLYLKDRYATSLDDPHPNRAFSGRIAGWLGQRIVDVIEGRGDSAPLDGSQKTALAR